MTDGPAWDLEFSWNAVPTVAGYRVLHSPVATFDSGVQPVGETDGATTSLTVDDVFGSDPALTFFQARALNDCGQEGP